MPIKRVLVVSDLHVGSIYGLLPPGFVTSEGREINLNSGQKYLWQCWEHASKTIGSVDAMVINGDAIDGLQQAQTGSELCLPLLEDQSEAAYVTLDMMQRAVGLPRLFTIQGTEYHDSKAGREMEVISQRLGAEKYSGIGVGRYCKEALDLEIGGAILNFSHGTSVASGLYRATPPDREAVWSALAGKQGKAPKADVVCRSHAHIFVHVEHPSKHALICPCWQLQTRFMRRHSIYRMLPDIGYVVIEIDTEARSQGNDPIKICKRTYSLPEPKVTHFERPSPRQTSGTS